MRRRIAVIAALAAFGAPAESAGAQNSVVGVSPYFWRSGIQGISAGRELRADANRIGLRLSFDYARQHSTHRGVAGRFSDSGFVFDRLVSGTRQVRTAGLWMSATVSPLRGRVRPYGLMALGIQDTFDQSITSSPDSVWRSDTWVFQPGSVMTRSWLGPAMALGGGMSVRFGGVRVFGESSRRRELRVVRNIYDVGWKDTPLVIGIRF